MISQQSRVIRASLVVTLFSLYCGKSAAQQSLLTLVPQESSALTATVASQPNLMAEPSARLDSPEKTHAPAAPALPLQPPLLAPPSPASVSANAPTPPATKPSAITPRTAAEAPSIQPLPTPQAGNPVSSPAPDVKKPPPTPPSSLAGPNLKLDLIAVIREVDGLHPSTQAKREELRAAESALSGAKQQRLPTLSVQTSRSNDVGSNTIATTRLQQPLFAGGRIDAGIQRTEAQISEAHAGLDLVRRDLMIRTTSTYAEIIKNRSRLEIATQNVKEHERLLESMSRRVAAEVSPESELMLTKSRLSQAQTEREQIALALRRAEEVMGELLNRPFTDILSVLPKPNLSVKSSIGDILDEAVGFSPEVRRALAQESVALSEVDQQKSAAWPSVFIRHEQLSGDLDPGQARSQTYVGVEFVPGAGLSIASQIRAAQSRRHAAVESRRTAEKDTRDKIRSLQAESLSLKQQLKTTQGYVQSARSVAESFSRQFTIGRKSWLEVLNAVRESALAELSLAEVSWNSQLIDLRLAIEIGRITPDNFPNP